METGTGKLRNYLTNILSPKIQDNLEMSIVLRFKIIPNVMVMIRVMIRVKVRVRVRIQILTLILIIILTLILILVLTDEE